MEPRGRLRALLLALVLLLTAAPAASAVVVHTHGGRFFGLTPHRNLNSAVLRRSIQGTSAPSTTAGSTTTSSTSGNLNYHSGPVLHSSSPYLIFWTPPGESMPASWQALFQRYFTDAAADSGRASNVYAVGRQYTDGSGFADAAQTFSASQVIVDSEPYPSLDGANCPHASGYATCISDTQLQAEVERVVAARKLPADGATTASTLPANAPVYCVVLPSDVNECLPANPDGSVDCADNSFCAYHSCAAAGSNHLLYSA